MKNIRSALTAAIALSLPFPVVALATEPALFHPLPSMMTFDRDDPALLAILNDPSSGVTRQVRTDAALVDKRSASMRIALAPGIEVIATRSDAYDAPDGTTVWHGSFDVDDLRRAGMPSIGTTEAEHDLMNYALLVRNGNMITGDIHVGGDIYSIRPLHSGSHAITQIDASRLPPPHTDDQLELMNSTADASAEHVPPNNTGTSSDRALDKTKTKVMILYAKRARRVVADMTGLGRLFIETTNKAFANSKIDTAIELAGPSVFGIEYDESGDQATDLNRVTYKDGVIDIVHAMRDTHQADLVALIVDDPNKPLRSCGVGWINVNASQAFSVTQYNCTGNYTFTHELGHNYGAAHDVANAGRAPYSYGYGYHQPQGNWGTVMAYPCRFGRGCPPLLAWSSPNLFQNGQPMGTVHTHHNQRVVDQRKAIVAGFR